MFCTKCGEQLEENDKFCKMCGNRVECESKQADTKSGSPEDEVCNGAYTEEGSVQGTAEELHVITEPTRVNNKVVFYVGEKQLCFSGDIVVFNSLHNYFAQVGPTVVRSCMSKYDECGDIDKLIEQCYGIGRYYISETIKMPIKKLVSCGKYDINFEKIQKTKGYLEMLSPWDDCFREIAEAYWEYLCRYGLYCYLYAESKYGI